MNHIPPSYASLPEWMRLVALAVNPLLQGVTDTAAKTAAYTIADGDGVILGDATSAAFTVTLPKAALFKGRRFTVKKVDASANAVTIGCNGAETIDGAATLVLAAQWAVSTVISDGTAWFVI